MFRWGSCLSWWKVSKLFCWTVDWPSRAALLHGSSWTGCNIDIHVINTNSNLLFRAGDILTRLSWWNRRPTCQKCKSARPAVWCGRRPWGVPSTLSFGCQGSRQGQPQTLTSTAAGSGDRSQQIPLPAFWTWTWDREQELSWVQAVLPGCVIKKKLSTFQCCESHNNQSNCYFDLTLRRGQWRRRYVMHGGLSGDERQSR